MTYKFREVGLLIIQSTNCVWFRSIDRYVFTLREILWNDYLLASAKKDSFNKRCAKHKILLSHIFANEIVANIFFFKRILSQKMQKSLILLSRFPETKSHFVKMQTAKWIQKSSKVTFNLSLFFNYVFKTLSLFKHDSVTG